MVLWEGKKYKLDKSENFEEYMKALGVGLIMRKMGNQVYPTVELIKEGDSYTLNTTSTFKSSSIKFKEGEEFDEVTVDGRNVKSTCTFEGENKLLHEQKDSKDGTLVSKISREFNAHEMIAEMTAGEVVCKRTYKVI